MFSKGIHQASFFRPFINIILDMEWSARGDRILCPQNSQSPGTTAQLLKKFPIGCLFVPNLAAIWFGLCQLQLREK